MQRIRRMRRFFCFEIRPSHEFSWQLAKGALCGYHREEKVHKGVPSGEGGRTIMKKAIVVVDMQKDFIDGALGTKEAQEMLPRMEAKLSAAQAAGTKLVFTMDTHGEDYLATQEGRRLPVPHCIRGTEGWEIAASLQPFVRAAAAVVEKPAFGSTELPALLEDCDEIELVGLCTDICVISNALVLKAFYPEKKISVDASCCAGVTPESHAEALRAMKMCQVDVK